MVNEAASASSRSDSPVRRMRIGILDWLIPLYPILAQYALTYGNAGLAILLAVVVATVLVGGIVHVHKKLFLLLVLIVLQQGVVLVFFDFGYSNIAFLGNMASMIAMVAALSAVAGNTTPEAVYRAYRIVALTISCILIYQFFVLTVLGQPVGAIAVVPISDELTGYWAFDSGRPSAFFTEAQTCSSALLPLVAWGLVKRDVRTAAFVSLGIVLTTSTLGILLVVLLWSYHTLKRRVSRLPVVMVSLTVLILIPSILGSGLGEYAGTKLISIVQNYSEYGAALGPGFSESTSYTNYLRLLKGPDTFFDLPYIEQLIGIGRYNVDGYIDATGHAFPWATIWQPPDSMTNYMSSLFGIPVEFGPIVALIYYAFLAGIYRRGGSVQKSMVVLLAAQTLASQFFFNGLHVFYLLLIFACEPFDRTGFVTLSLAGKTPRRYQRHRRAELEGSGALPATTHPAGPQSLNSSGADPLPGFAEI